MRFALGYRKGMPPGMGPQAECYVEALIENLGRWFPKHRCLVGVNFAISCVADNVAFVGFQFNVPMLGYVGIGGVFEMYYLPMKNALVAASFKCGPRTAHMTVGVPADIDFAERDCCFMLLVYSTSVTPQREPRYPSGRYRHDGHDLASLYVDGGS